MERERGERERSTATTTPPSQNPNRLHRNSVEYAAIYEYFVCNFRMIISQINRPGAV